MRYVHSPSSLCRGVYRNSSSSFINRASTSNITCMHRYMATQKPTNQRLWRRETTTRLPYTIDGYGDLNQHQMLPKFIVRHSQITICDFPKSNEYSLAQYSMYVEERRLKSAQGIHNFITTTPLHVTRLCWQEKPYEAPLKNNSYQG